MSDIEDLLNRTARSADMTPSPDVVESDVRRGRAALVRRRRRRAIGSSIGGTVAAAAIVASAIVVGSPDGSGEAPTAQPDQITAPDGSASGVALVAYNGEQPEGYIVERVPEGWYIQEPEHPEYSLTIARDGDNSHPDAYEGKLTIFLLTSSAQQELPKGEPVKVGEYDGVVDPNSGEGYATLTYADDAGHFVQVQSPPVLGWSNERLARFAEGVTATSDAKAGIG